MTTQETTRILLVEDSEDDALLLETVLAPVMPGLEMHRVDCASDMTEALNQPWDLVISDHSMPRFDAFRATAGKMGVTVKSVYWTVGSCDIVVTMDGPEDAVTAVLLKIGSLGNVRSQTLRAYGEDEFRRILAAMP